MIDWWTDDEVSLRLRRGIRHVGGSGEVVRRWNEITSSRGGGGERCWKSRVDRILEERRHSERREGNLPEDVQEGHSGRELGSQAIADNVSRHSFVVEEEEICCVTGRRAAVERKAEDEVSSALSALKHIDQVAEQLAKFILGVKEKFLGSGRIWGLRELGEDENVGPRGRGYRIIVGEVGVGVADFGDGRQAP